jgi:hypothetical protein
MAFTGEITGKCCSCKEEKPLSQCNTWKQDDNTYIRCKVCAAWPGKLGRVLKRCTATEASCIRSLSKEDKMAFMLANADHVGEALKKAVQSYGSKEEKSVEVESFHATGQFFTALALREKYVKEPEIAENTISNGYSFKDPIKGVQLYEDLQYQSAKGESKSMENTAGWNMEAKESMRPVKRVKAEASPGSLTDGPKPLKEGVIKRLKNLHAKLQQTIEEGSVFLDKVSAEKYEDFVPKAQLKKAVLTHAQASSEMASLFLCCADGWSGDPRPIIDSGALVLGNLMKDLSRLDMYAKECPDEDEEDLENADEEDGKTSDGKPAEMEEGTKGGTASASADGAVAIPAGSEASVTSVSGKRITGKTAKA